MPDLIGHLRISRTRYSDNILHKITHSFVEVIPGSRELFSNIFQFIIRPEHVLIHLIGESK